MFVSLLSYFYSLRLILRKGWMLNNWTSCLTHVYLFPPSSLSKKEHSNSPNLVFSWVLSFSSLPFTFVPSAGERKDKCSCVLPLLISSIPPQHATRCPSPHSSPLAAATARTDYPTFSSHSMHSPCHFTIICRPHTYSHCRDCRLYVPIQFMSLQKHLDQPACIQCTHEHAHAHAYLSR